MSRWREVLDVQSPALEPLWLRIAIAGGCLLWALREFAGGAGFWGVMFGAAGLYLCYQFFVVWDPKRDDDDKEGGG